MKLLFVLFPLLTVCSCNKTAKTETASVIDTTSTESEKPYYTMLDQTQPGNVKTYNLLIDSTSTQIDAIKQAVQMFVVAECTVTPCNDVRIWSSERAYRLYQAKTNHPAWRKQFWPYIAERYVADYKATVNTLTLFPCLDSDYRRWGGRQQRPTPHSIDL